MSTYTPIPNLPDDQLVAWLNQQIAPFDSVGVVGSYNLSQSDDPTSIDIQGGSEHDLVTYANSTPGQAVVSVNVEKLDGRTLFTGSFDDALAFCQGANQ